MPTLSGAELRGRFLEYFRAQGHALIPSASLVPEGDPTVLFTTAGMHPLVPYLLGAPHPAGKRLTNVQKCLRTDDLEEVGDANHLTFFEMLGNWSLGDYFKEDAIEFSHEFLTADRFLGIPLDRLVITCFAGDATVPKDTQSAAIWQKLGIPKDHIFFFGRKENWWGPPGTTGPCGPDTEMFFDTGKPGRAPNDGTERFVEIWNDVFMQYNQEADGSLTELAQKNVDTGMGLERTVAALNGHPSVYATDLFQSIVATLRAGARQADERQLRIAADHFRAAVFVLADARNVMPSNVEHGYVLRRLIRRALRALELLGLPSDGVTAALDAVTGSVASVYGAVYPEVRQRADHVREALCAEARKYGAIKERAARWLKQRRQRGTARVSGSEAFDAYATLGFHPDLLRSLGEPLGIAVDLAGFEAEFQKHQEVSRAGVTQRFAGGLADHDPRTVRMHTATHLLHEALRRVLGTHVEQKGSNITTERLRFDFSHPQRVTTSELRRVEALVNEQIRRDLPVTRAVMTPAAANTAGALGFFGEKYGDQVSVYTVGDFSKEICGGPHVEHTGVIGAFRIQKEEPLAAGIRRIRATVEESRAPPEGSTGRCSGQPTRVREE